MLLMNYILDRLETRLVTTNCNKEPKTLFTGLCLLSNNNCRYKYPVDRPMTLLKILVLISAELVISVRVFLIKFIVFMLS